MKQFLKKRSQQGTVGRTATYTTCRAHPSCTEARAQKPGNTAEGKIHLIAYFLKIALIFFWTMCTLYPGIARTHTHTHTHTRAYTHTHTHTHHTRYVDAKWKHVNRGCVPYLQALSHPLCVCVCVCVCVCALTHSHTLTHTHIHESNNNNTHTTKHNYILRRMRCRTLC